MILFFNQFSFPSHWMCLGKYLWNCPQLRLSLFQCLVGAAYRVVMVTFCACLWLPQFVQVPYHTHLLAMGLNKKLIERRIILWCHVTMVAKFQDLNNLSWQRQPFALSKDRRKIWATVLFLSAIMYRKVIHVQFFLFFWHNCRTMVCWDWSQKILLPWQHDLKISPLYFIHY